ncbi:hypothetical protein ABT160_25415 [Streptomyces sp. NPDC001941]|uniref:hypothetical protein n=1 Tax=Streptomyces sp. NPDC001941 TaxID=3154659 RepID=UPI00332E06AF
MPEPGALPGHRKVAAPTAGPSTMMSRMDASSPSGSSRGPSPGASPGPSPSSSPGSSREMTPDGHHIVINGRKWRATDPALPEDVASRLRHHLMAARRAVRTALADGDARAERTARSRVQQAKEALGERGTPWWELTERERRERWERGLGRLEAEPQE